MSLGAPPPFGHLEVAEARLEPALLEAPAPLRRGTVTLDGQGVIVALVARGRECRVVAGPAPARAPHTPPGGRS
jgi:hypothetical protein